MILVLLVAMALEQVSGAAQVPLPPFAVDRRDAKSTPYDFEVSFRPGPGHDLDQVRAFYLSWTDSQGWRQVSKAEEGWAADEWFSYTDETGRHVRRRLAHWVDPSGTRSLRLALRHLPETNDQTAVVFVAPFNLIPNHVDPSESLREESPDDWRRGSSRLEFRFVRPAGSATTGLLVAPNGEFYVSASEAFVNDADLEGVEVERHQDTCVVSIAFKASSAERLQVITSRRLGLIVGIIVEGKLVWAAGLGGPLGEGVMIPAKSCEEAEDLAGRLSPAK